LSRAIRDSDLLIAVKPRVLSYGLASVVHGDRPLILDIDDLEHPFTRRRLGFLRQLVTPDREPVTRLLEKWRGQVAGITVASRTLQRRYGGSWLPHVRDRSGLAAAARNGRLPTRIRLGLEEAFVVGFIGTVRPHKGLMSLADSVRQLGGNARLLVAGDLGDAQTMETLNVRSGGRVLAIDGVAMSDIGALLGACDVVGIPQSATSEAAHQSPAKLFDALAAGRPVVVGDIGDAREIVGSAGLLVPPDDAAALAVSLAELRTNADLRAALSQAALSRMDETFGLDAWRATMASILRPHLPLRADP